MKTFMTFFGHFAILKTILKTIYSKADDDYGM